MKLTDAKIRNAKPANKPFKLFDGKGLYLYVSTRGAKSWRLDYAFYGKRRTLALGLYPEISLSEARKRHQEARQTIASGVDPSIKKKIKKRGEYRTFEANAREWWEANRAKWTPGYTDAIWRRLKQNIHPWLGDRPVNEITTLEILETLKRIEKRGAYETARRVAQIVRQVFIFAIASGRCENNPASDIAKALTVPTPRHFPAITEPKRIGELMRAIDGFEGSLVVGCALRLAPHVFVRPGELRKMEWGEIDLDNALWTIPAEKMKRKRPHLVPLSTQAVEIVREIQPLTGAGRWVFPANRLNGTRPMSNNTLNVALQRLGFDKSEMVPHGFRTMASTRLHEMGFPSDIIEAQLAHVDKNSVRAVYNRAQYLDARREMMQAWADYLDGLKTGADVIPINKRA